MPSLAHNRLYIDGQFVDTQDHYEVRYPHNNEAVATVARAGDKEMEAAIAAATRARGQS